MIRKDNPSSVCGTFSPHEGRRPLLLVVLFLITTFAFACKRGETAAPPMGDVGRGKQLMAQYACTACHVVPGTQGLQGRLGPSLAGVASRPAISNGTVPNTPENLRRFIVNPAALNPRSSMPPIAIPDADAKDITAFLRTLR